MKKFTKICLTITAIVAALGIVLCGVSVVLGGSWEEAAKRMEETGIDGFMKDWFWDNAVYTNTLDAGKETCTDTFKVEEFNHIDIELDLADVKVIKSEDAENVKVTMKKGYLKHYSCELDGKTLEIEYDTGNHNYKSGPEIILEIPDGIELKKIEADTALGDITFEGLTLNINTLDVHSNLGNVKFTDMEILCDIKAGTDLGDVKFLNGTYGKMNLENSLGDITITGEVTDDVKACCDMGDVKVELSGKESDYNYSLSTDMGDVEINDVDYNKEMSGEADITNKGAEITLTLESDMGDVTVTTK